MGLFTVVAVVLATVATAAGNTLRGLQSSTPCSGRQPGIYCVSSDAEASWVQTQLAAGGAISYCSDSYFVCAGNDAMVLGPVVAVPDGTRCLPMANLHPENPYDWTAVLAADVDGDAGQLDHLIDSTNALCAVPTA